MILKTKREAVTDNLNEKVWAWEFKDGITQITSEEVGLLEKSKYIFYTHKGADIIQAVDNETYLLNDEGKTIERLF
ncbi:MAG: hypothetical protein WCO84_01115 [bacterium]